MVLIYILQLEEGKYYIGKTNNPHFRLEAHFDANGSAWTRTYKPLNVLEIITDCDDFDEDKITIRHMEKYGINNVRGGSFSSVKLDEETRTYIERMIRGANDRCFNCGQSDHFVQDCPANNIHKNKEKKKKPKNLWGSILDFVLTVSQHFEDERREQTRDDGRCYRCGRHGHYATSCYARTHRDGSRL